MSTPAPSLSPIGPIREEVLRERDMEPIPITENEMKVMEPYLGQMASAAHAFKSAQSALEAIAKTIGGRAGAPVNRQYKLDVAGRRLVPIG